MTCPYCESPAYEDAPECQRCGITMDKADQYFGTAPPLQPGVNDTSKALSARDQKRVSIALNNLEGHFPQLGFTIVYLPLALTFSAQAYAFWLFNHRALGGAAAMGGANRHILILVDTAGQRAAITVGYGLEPFLGKHALLECLWSAIPAYHDKRYAQGTLLLLEALGKRIKAICEELPRAFGLPPSSLEGPARYFSAKEEPHAV